jgi:creatinine amidohydrolase/Fe(II)-dependent formamide hydrolase-like protein
VSISAATLHAIISDVITSLKASGIHRLLIVNGHGGNYVLSNIVQEASVAGPRLAEARVNQESQIREFVRGLVRQLLADPDLVNQTKVNSKKQFMESRDFQAAVTEAVADNRNAHNTMADYFFSDGPGTSSVITALADAFYEAAIDQ